MTIFWESPDGQVMEWAYDVPGPNDTYGEDYEVREIGDIHFINRGDPITIGPWQRWGESEWGDPDIGCLPPAVFNHFGVVPEFICEKCGCSHAQHQHGCPDTYPGKLIDNPL